MNLGTDDWRGEHLIRAPKRITFDDVSESNHAQQRALRRMQIAMSPTHDALAAKLVKLAAAGKSQKEAAAELGVTRSWVCEVSKFRKILFVSSRPHRRKGLIS